MADPVVDRGGYVSRTSVGWREYRRLPEATVPKYTESGHGMLIRYHNEKIQIIISHTAETSVT